MSPMRTASSINDTQYTVIGFVWLMLCPLLSIPYLLYGIYQRRAGAFVLFSLLLGIFAYISFPSEDLYRHYFLYTYLAIRPLSAISWIDISLNGILPFIYWSMSHTGITYGWLRFMELSVGFFLLCKVFNEQMDQSQPSYTPRERFIRFILLFLFFDFMYTTMGVKFGFALCLYIFSMHLFFKGQHRWTGVLFFILTCMWHSSFLFTGPAVFVFYRLNPSKRTTLFICVALMVIIPLFIHVAGAQLLGRRFEFYFSKKADTVASYSAMTPIGLALYILPKLTVIPLAFLMVKYHSREARWGRVAMGWLVLSVAMITNAVTFYRFWWAFMAVSVIAFFELEQRRTLSRLVLPTLLTAGVLFTCLNMTTYHKELLNSPYYKSLYPAPLTLSEDYDKQVVYYKIQHDGDFK